MSGEVLRFNIKKKIITAILLLEKELRKFLYFYKILLVSLRISSILLRKVVYSPKGCPG